jgi:transposase
MGCLFSLWARARAWAGIHDALRDRARVRAGRHPLPTAAVIDSASVRGADTVPAASRGYDAGKRGQRPQTPSGRRHRRAAADRGRHRRRHPGPRRRAPRLLTALRAKFSTIGLVWAGAVLGLAVTIVKRTDDLAGFRVIPRRWVVERTLAWISKHRRCVRDYETLPEHSEAMVYIAMIMTMSRRLAR